MMVTNNKKTKKKNHKRKMMTETRPSPKRCHHPTSIYCVLQTSEKELPSELVKIKYFKEKNNWERWRIWRKNVELARIFLITIILLYGVDGFATTRVRTRPLPLYYKWGDKNLFIVKAHNTPGKKYEWTNKFSKDDNFLALAKFSCFKWVRYKLNEIGNYSYYIHF